MPPAEQSQQWASSSGSGLPYGIVEVYLHAGKRIGVLVELGCESDFVATSREFQKLARDIAMHIAATNPRCISLEDSGVGRSRFRDEALRRGLPEAVGDIMAYGGRFDPKTDVLLNQLYIRDPSKTIGQLVKEFAERIREDIVIRRFSRFEVSR